MWSLTRRFAAAALLVTALFVGQVAADSSARGLTFRVLQFNVRFDFDSDGANRWAQRVDLVAGLIRNSKASVACLQEDKREQVEDLKRALPGWAFVGKSRDGRSSEMCSVAYQTASWRCVETGDFWLSDTPATVGSNTWGCKFPHKVTWARLEPATDPLRRQVLFLSTHFDEHKDKGEVRRKSALVIRTWLRQNAGGAGVVLCGDFNAAVTEEPHALLLERSPEARLRDAWEVVQASDPNPGTVHGFTGRSHRRRIDWILVGDALAPLDVKLDRWNLNGRYPSDHFPVAAELELSPAARAQVQGARKPVGTPAGAGIR